MHAAAAMAAATPAKPPFFVSANVTAHAAQTTTQTAMVARVAARVGMVENRVRAGKPQNQCMQDVRVCAVCFSSWTALPYGCKRCRVFPVKRKKMLKI